MRTKWAHCRHGIGEGQPLAFLWRKLVAEGVAKGMPAQTEQLVEKAVNE